MINISKKSECCGCGACVQICPKNCIDFVNDQEGFWYPRINQEKCIGCNLCENVCPNIKCEEKKDDILEAYVSYANDDKLRNKSSSGGIFSVLAMQILKRGGIIFGAAFDANMLVSHIGISSVSELEKLQGSKYLQSRTEMSYFEAERALKAGKWVLYSGTACQISGLKKYLRREYTNLVTVDVLCHGVPSPKVWERYLDDQQKLYNGRIKKVSLRQKSKGWKAFSTELIFDNEKKYEQVYTKDPYMQLFLKNICLRPSCYDCNFKSLNRDSDITIGDCWGIEKYMPEMDDDRGTSVVLVHSQQGKSLLQECKQSLVLRTAEVDRALPPWSDSRKSVPIHRNRDKLFKKLEQGKSTQQLLRLTEDSILIKVKRKVKGKIKKILLRTH